MKKRCISWILAFMMLMSVPTFAWANEAKASGQAGDEGLRSEADVAGGQDRPGSEDPQGTQADPESEDPQGTQAGLGSEDPQGTQAGLESEDPQGTQAAAEPAEPEDDVVFRIMADEENAIRGAGNISIDQDKVNSPEISVTLTDLKALKKKGDTLRLTAKMKYGKKAAVKKTYKIKLNKVDAVTGIWTVKAPAFGKYAVTLDLMKGKKKVRKLKTATVKVIAQEYNLLQLRATTPVLVTTLKLLGDESYTRMESGDAIPTIVWLSRVKQYNWNALPANWYRNPFEDAKSSKTTERLESMYAYVGMLKEISPDSMFHFYVNDYHLREMSEMVYGNQFDAGSYTLTMVTDGSASYAWFGKTYGQEANAQEKHNRMVADFKAYREAVCSGKDYQLQYGVDKNYPLRSYAYAIVDAETDNGVPTQWWVVRKSRDTFDMADTAFQEILLGDSRVSSNYINGLLSKVQEGNNEPVFKKLYNFDDSLIRDAVRKGKKPMMILGTSKAGETADPISPYVRFTMSYYGNDYAYFYKGHPGYITESDPDRVLAMRSLGMNILDSSIAAELFQYYNPDLYMSGYQSSTFQNAGSASNDCGLFNVSKEAGMTQVYGKDMDYFMSNMSKVTDETILALVPEKKNENYLVEFSDEIIQSSGNAIAIWDATDAVIYFYKKDGSGYTLVSTKEGLKDETLTMPKTVTVKGAKALAGGKVKVSWKKDSAAQGYQVQLATNQNFTRNVKTYRIKGSKKVTCKTGKLKLKKKYYVRVRAYTTVSFNGDRLYADWSRVKKVRTRK